MRLLSAPSRVWRGTVEQTSKLSFSGLSRKLSYSRDVLYNVIYSIIISLVFPTCGSSISGRSRRLFIWLRWLSRNRAGKRDWRYLAESRNTHYTTKEMQDAKCSRHAMRHQCRSQDFPSHQQNFAVRGQNAVLMALLAAEVICNSQLSARTEGECLGVSGTPPHSSFS